MSRFKNFFLLFLACLLLATTGCARQNRLDVLKYKNRLLEDRAKKNKFFKFSENSPIPSTKRWEFTELHYFPPDVQYQVPAQYKPYASKDELTIPTSSGQARVYVKTGIFEFVLFNTKQHLTAYQEKAWLQQEDHPSLFVPFLDKTSGVSTYGAGRYLDIPVPQEKQAILDFNLAYNPYCAYSTNFSCPLTPLENTLLVSIEAGEKN